MATVTVEDLLKRLASLNISTPCHVHAPVETVEAMVDELGKLGVHGTHVKNLFLKDRKGRLYVITAHADTPVNLKTLSARMGLGKGGIRFAPNEALEPVLQVAPGSVTPLALVQPTARRVVLMLDERLRGAESLLVHPLRNDRTVSMHSSELEAFLGSIGQAVNWVDLTFEPVYNKDYRPDLALLVPELDDDEPSADTKPAKPAPPQPVTQAATAAAVVDPAAYASQVVEHVVKGIGGCAMAPEARAKLVADVATVLLSLKNAAYAAGFADSRVACRAALTKEWA